MDYKDEIFDRAVGQYREKYDSYPILARTALMRYLGAKEIVSSCTLCTRDCPIRNDGIISCEFDNSGHTTNW